MAGIEIGSIATIVSLSIGKGRDGFPWSIRIKRSFTFYRVR